MKRRRVSKRVEVFAPKTHPLTDPDGEIADPDRVPRQEGEPQLQRPGKGGEDREGEGSDVFVECHPLRKDLRDLRCDRPEEFQVLPGKGPFIYPVRQVQRSKGLPVMRQGKGQERPCLVPVLLEGVSDGGIFRPGNDEGKLMGQNPLGDEARMELPRGGNVFIGPVETNHGGQRKISHRILDHDGSSSGAESLHRGEKQDLQELVHVDYGAAGIEDLVHGKILPARL